MPKFIPTLAALLVGLMLFSGSAVSLARDNSGGVGTWAKSSGHKSQAKKARVKSGKG